MDALCVIENSFFFRSNIPIIASVQMRIKSGKKYIIGIKEEWNNGEKIKVFHNDISNYTAITQIRWKVLTEIQYCYTLFEHT